MSQKNSPYKLDLKKIQADFAKAAKDYDAASVLTHEVGQRMVERLEWITMQPQVVLDLGSGTGHFTTQLAKRYPNATIIAVDIVEAMLRFSEQKEIPSAQHVCADAYALPLKNNSINLIFANFLLPWCEDSETLFREICRVLAPEGLFVFTSFGPDTFQELRYSWYQVDEYMHVHPFMDMHDVGDGLLRAKLIDPVLDMEYFTILYADLKDFFADLKASGMTNKLRDRKPGLTTPRQLDKMQARYASLRNEAQQYPVTYEVVYGHAWGPAFTVDAVADAAGVTKISLEQVRRSLKK